MIWLQLEKSRTRIGGCHPVQRLRLQRHLAASNASTAVSDPPQLPLIMKVEGSERDRQVGPTYVEGIRRLDYGGRISHGRNSIDLAIKSFSPPRRVRHWTYSRKSKRNLVSEPSPCQLRDLPVTKHEHSASGLATANPKKQTRWRYPVFAIDHAATALLVKRRFPSAPMRRSLSPSRPWNWPGLHSTILE
jgi:hypothetical protein